MEGLLSVFLISIITGRMSKRVFQVAQELGMANQSLIERIKDLGIDDSVTTSLSTISDANVEKLKAALASQPSASNEEKPLPTGVVRRRAPRRRPEPEAEVTTEAAPAPEAPKAPVESSPAEEAAPAPEAAEAAPARRRFATVTTRDSDDTSRPEAEPAAEAPLEVAAAAPAVEAPVEPEAPAERPRRRFATVTTRSDLDETAEAAPAAPVVETRTIEVDPPVAAVAAEEAQEEAKPARRSRFATVVTRRTVEEPVVVEAAPEPVVEVEAPKPRARFATVVTNRTDDDTAAKRSPVELAEIARREADAASRSRGGAEILGTIDIDVLNQRNEQRRGPGGRGPGGPAGPPGPRGPGGPGGPPGPGAPAGDFAGGDQRRGKRGKRVVQSGELYGKFNRGRGGNRKNQRRGGGQPVRQTTAAEHKRVVRMEESILISELAHQMGVKAGEIVMKLAFDLGLRGANINTPVDHATASLIAEQYNHKVEMVGFDMTKFLPDYDNSEESLLPRPPVVTVMGHVDHGKTSLLDRIRSTGQSVAQGEAGGITQHIGAYKVQIPQGEVTFLDTPGHEAFSALRARGALATDIVILVVAGDDGIMPQTVEALAHAREAEVPVIVAITKMDKHSADAQKVKLTFTQHNLIDEAIGGDTVFVEVSSKTGEGIEKLLEAVILQAEVMELKANPNRKADGLTIEARLDVGRGPIATVLVQGGTLNVGDIVVIGKQYGRVRSMSDEFTTGIRTALPSTPVEITGLSGVPASGEKFYVVEEERNARTIAEHVAVQTKQAEMAVSASGMMRASSGTDLDSFLPQNDKELKVIIKGDVQGSVEALVQAIKGLANEQVRVRIIHSGVGSITESDVNLASSSGADSDVLICGFNTRPEQRALALADQNGVHVLTHTVIYDMLDEVRLIMGGLLDPVFEEEILGHAEVRMVFQNSRVGAVAGSLITDGLIRRGAHARVLRDNNVVFKSTIGSLRNVERDEREMKAGFECGISVERFADFKPGDVIECYLVHERKAVLL